MNDDDLNLPPGMSEQLDELAPGINTGDLLAAIVTEADHLPPPEWKWVLETMRDIIEATGDSIGMVLAATDHESLMIPAPFGPTDPVKMLYAMRKTRVLDSVNWVACAADTYVRTAIDANGFPTDGISPTEAFKAGMPDAWESLMAICVAPDGPGYNVQQRYLRTPEGIVWQEPEQAKASAGPLVGVMNEVVLA